MFYRRIKGRIGGVGAVTATAHKLSRLVYRMLKYGSEYVKHSMEEYESDRNVLPADQGPDRRRGCRDGDGPQIVSPRVSDAEVWQRVREAFDGGIRIRSECSTGGSRAGSAAWVP